MIFVFVFVLGHSDPEKLKESAQSHQKLSPSELQKRQLEIKVIQVFYVCDLYFLFIYLFIYVILVHCLWLLIRK